MLMENFLCLKEYWSFNEKAILVWQQMLKDLEGNKLNFYAISRVVLKTIFNKDASKGMWDPMKQNFQGSNRVKKAQLQALRMDFEILHMK
jgi:hypothetical protein